MKLDLKVPPVAQGIIAVLLIWLFNQYIPLYHLKFTNQNIIVIVLICIGTITALSGVYAFIKLRTTVDPRYPEKADKLVIIGIYKYSRNPMYLGLLMIISGIAVYFGAVSNIISIILFVIFITKYQIIPEENALKEKFGESYENYIKNVRRWI